ncbi:MAG TPA: hypothetical protein VN285_13345 [Candidatus Deferrimicrobium sp.]|nr:hypothetical protein [Candidatus Deferrimicrobium sp.]
MASIQSRIGKAGRKISYLVLSFHGKHRRLKTGSLKDAKLLKKGIESMDEARRIVKLGLTARDRHVDEFFQEYSGHVRLRAAPNTLKRYRAALNAFLASLRLFDQKISFLSQITPEIIEDFQQKRVESVELKAEADGEKSV